MEEKGIDFESSTVSVIPNANFQSKQQGEQIKAAVEAALEKIKKENNQYIPLDFKINLENGTSIIPLINENGTLGDEVIYSSKAGKIALTYDKLGAVIPDLNPEKVILAISATVEKMNSEIFTSYEDAIKDIAAEDIEKVTEIITEEPKRQREKVVAKEEYSKDAQEKEPNLSEKLQAYEKQVEMDKKNSEPIKTQEPVK